MKQEEKLPTEYEPASDSDPDPDEFVSQVDALLVSGIATFAGLLAMKLLSSTLQ